MPLARFLSFLSPPFNSLPHSLLLPLPLSLPSMGNASWTSLRTITTLANHSLLCRCSLTRTGAETMTTRGGRTRRPASDSRRAATRSRRTTCSTTSPSADTAPCSSTSSPSRSGGRRRPSGRGEVFVCEWGVDQDSGSS